MAAYTVQKGDSAWQIAQHMTKQGMPMSWQDVYAAAGANIIHPGQVLNFNTPAPSPAATPASRPTVSRAQDHMRDPAYISFLSQLGIEQSQTEADIKAGRLESAQNIQNLRRERDNSWRQTGLAHDQDYEDRGFFRSSDWQKERGRKYRANLDAYGSRETQMRQSQAAQERKGARDLATLSRTNVQQQLAARQRMTQNRLGLG